MKYSKSALTAAAKGNNKQRLLNSDLCGCYFCKSTFHPFRIAEWTLDDAAICPNCGIDAVIGENPTKDFLEDMNRFWFSTEKI